MTFMRKIMDFLNMGNWQNGCYITEESRKECLNVDEDSIEKECKMIKNYASDSVHIEMSNRIDEKSGKDDNNTLQKSYCDTNTFLWQCNSVADLRDSERVGFEYTELNNPNDVLEVGYRDALLEISDYNNLPIIDTTKDRYANGGYVPRRMLKCYHDFELCKNIFIGCEIPIVKEIPTINRNINTTIFMDTNGAIGRSVQEIFFYDVTRRYEAEFIKLINVLNEFLYKYDGLQEFIIDTSEIKFDRTANEYVDYSLPLSKITYDCDKQICMFSFSNELKLLDTTYDFTKYSYTHTEYGEIIYAMDGRIRKAVFTKIIDGKKAVIKYKGYKSGLDLFNIKYNEIIYYNRSNQIKG